MARDHTPASGTYVAQPHRVSRNLWAPIWRPQLESRRGLAEPQRRSSDDRNRPVVVRSPHKQLMCGGHHARWRACGVSGTTSPTNGAPAPGCTAHVPGPAHSTAPQTTARAPPARWAPGTASTRTRTAQRARAPATPCATSCMAAVTRPCAHVACHRLAATPLPPATPQRGWHPPPPSPTGCRRTVPRPRTPWWAARV